MTIKEALTTKTSTLRLSSAELDLALLDAGLDGTPAYDPITNAKDVDMVWAGLLLTAIQLIEVREDDVSIKYSTDLKGIYSFLMNKYGLPDPFAVAKPSVTQVNFW